MDKYDVVNEISDELDFVWWVKETINRRVMIISRVKSKYCRTSHKFWIQVHKKVK